MPYKILFYDDALECGGHETMALNFIKRIAALGGYDLHVVCSAYNQRLVDKLHTIETITVTELPLGRLRAPFLMGFLSFKKIASIRRVIRDINPDCVVVIQGNIEISVIGLLAAKLEKRKTVSYLPMAHSMKMYRVRYAWLRDAIDSVYYRLFDKIVTISETQKNYIADRLGPGIRVGVVPNFIETANYCTINRDLARQKLDIDHTTYCFAMVGRVHFVQKGHDFLVEAVKRHRDACEGINFLIVGDGPDLSTLKSRVQEYGLENYFSFRPWMDDLSLVYSAADALLMPSNYEGVPIVMIEALYYGKAVIANNVDGMKDYLPKEWLFDKNEIGTLFKAIEWVRKSNQTELIQTTIELVQNTFFRKEPEQEFLHEVLD